MKYRGRELSVVRCQLSVVSFQISEIQIDRRSKETKLFGVCPVVGLYHGAAASPQRQGRVAVGAPGRAPAMRGRCCPQGIINPALR